MVSGYKAHAKAGLCHSCKRPAAKGRTRCKICGAKEAARQALVRAKRKG